MAKRKQAKFENETGKKSKRKRRPLGRLLFLSVAGAGLALATSSSLRSKVLDKLFGAENEFQYSPPPASPVAPAAGDDPPAAA
jgi:hypothetical protein